MFGIHNDGIIGEINAMNQRGGRMLSIIDLIEANTLSIELATYLTSRVIKGCSVSSGSQIGGTGKTTLLAALLGLLPANHRIVAVTHDNVTALLDKKEHERTVYLCHEISPANFYSYLWGSDLGKYFSLIDDRGENATNGHLAFTIHADTPEEVYPQIINNQTGVKEKELSKIDMLIFIKSFYGGKRRVTYLYEWDNKSGKHVLTWKWDRKSDTHIRVEDPFNGDLRETTIEKNALITSLFNRLLSDGVRRIEEVREFFLKSLSL